MGRSSSPRPGLPAHQAFFPLGAGPEGIPTGSPLAPGSGRYLSKHAVWGLGCLIIVGLLVGAYGIGAYQAGALSLAAAPMIVVGGLLFFGPMVVAFVSAWRAGIRPPGFSRNASFFEIQIAGSLMSGVLWGVADALRSGSGPALAVRGVSIIVGSIAVGIGTIPTVWSAIRNPHHLRGWDRWLWAGGALAMSLLFILWVTGALPQGDKYD
ncbi:MAG: hypothetical protein M3P53_10610 [Actinomycetota bacterium]|nr:hypothetical protein [Actinomycetota bacterium]